MAKIVEQPVRSRGVKCSCCAEFVPPMHPYLQVVNENGSDRRGERYCVDCRDVATENNPDITELDDGERHLRQMEDYAAYRAAGCTEAYYEDRDAGYCH